MKQSISIMKKKLLAHLKTWSSYQSQGLMSYGSCNPRCHDSRMPDAWWGWGWQWWSCGSDNINRSANITRSTCSISDFEALFKQSAHKCLAAGKDGTSVSGTDEGIFHQNENKKVLKFLIVTFICFFRVQVQQASSAWNGRLQKSGEGTF